MSKFIRSFFVKTNLSAFRAAILANDTNRICRILDIERDHISKELDSAGNTALLLAITHASPLTARVLIEQGAHPDKVNGLTFQTPLSILASKIYENIQSQEAKIALEMAIILLDNGAFIDKPSPYMFTDENGKDYLVRETPLMTAVRTKNLPMAILFIQRKANVNYFDKQTENRPIHFSITNGDVVMFDLLENAGASCRSVITIGKNTLLHWFCYNKANDEHISLFRKLIDNGCDVNAVNDDRRTPLMLAAKLDMINTCFILLHAGADIDKIDYQGLGAIDFAKLGGECFIFLQQAQKTKHQSDHSTDRVVWRKQISTSRSQPSQRNGSINALYMDENKIQRYSLNQSETSNSFLSHTSEPDLDTKYKRMWEKVLQTKEKIRRTRDTSLQRAVDCSRQRNRDISQQRYRDVSQQRTIDINKTTEL